MSTCWFPHWYQSALQHELHLHHEYIKLSLISSLLVFLFSILSHLVILGSKSSTQMSVYTVWVSLLRLYSVLVQVHISCPPGCTVTIVWLLNFELWKFNVNEWYFSGHECICNSIPDSYIMFALVSWCGEKLSTHHYQSHYQKVCSNTS